MAARLVPFVPSTRVQVERLRDCLLSPDNRFLALRTNENVLSLLSLVAGGSGGTCAVSGAFVNGFQASGVLFYDFVYMGRTLLVTVNSQGSLVLYQYTSGHGNRGFYVRVVSKKTVSDALGVDPVLARFDEREEEEEEETVSSWEVSLERIGALLKKEKVLAVLQLQCVGRHVALVLRGAKSGPLVAVLDVTPRMLALRRWWAAEEGPGREIHLDPDLVLGRREGPGVTDLGPRSLGTDVATLPEVGATAEDRPAAQLQPWTPPPQVGKKSAPVAAATAAAVSSPPPGMIETVCEGGRKRIWVGSDGIYLPGFDKQKCLKATLTFQGPDAVFELVAANKWAAEDIRLFALELVFRHGDAEGGRKALQDLPRALRPRAHALAAAAGPMKWELLREWASACALWAEEDGDEEAAAAVRRARLLCSAAAVAATAAPSPAAPATRRGLKFEEQPASGGGAWQPKKAARKAWDGKSDEEVVRLACLQGALGQGLSYLRWRSGNQAATMTSIMELAREAAYRTLCRGELEEATQMIGNSGAENVAAELQAIRLQTLRPSVRAVTRAAGGAQVSEAEAMLDELAKVYRCAGGPVDDYPQLSRAVPEEEEDEEDKAGAPSKPFLRVSLQWIAQWGREQARDVLLEGLYRGWTDGTQQGPPPPHPPAPAWDPLNLRLLSYFVRHGDERSARKMCGRFRREDEAAIREALVGGAPHAVMTVLWELAKSGVHPHGVSRETACAVGAMLVLDETSAACVKVAVQLRRASMFHLLLDAKAKLPQREELPADSWTELALSMRESEIDVAKVGRQCAALIHGNADLNALGRPLISVTHDLFCGKAPNPEQLEALGVPPHIWDPLEGADAPSSFDPMSLLPAEAVDPPVAPPFVVQRPPTVRQWLAREMPFRASNAADATMGLAELLAAEYPRRHAPPFCNDWMQELLESSLDPGRPVFPVNRHVAMVINGLQCPPVSELPEVISLESLLPMSFERAWVQLRMRREAWPLLESSNPSPEAIAQLIEQTLATQTAWDMAHLLAALAAWKPELYARLQSNWSVIVAHNLDPALLHRSANDVGAALRARGLWDAARKHNPEQRDATTLAQAERMQPQWERIAALFEAQQLPLPLREQFWLARAAECDEQLDVALLGFAKQSSESAELEARFIIAECGGWSWSRFTAAPETERLALLERVTGTLAAHGDLPRVAALCKTLGLVPTVTQIAQRAGARTLEDLEPFLEGRYGAGWRHWAQGKVLRLRALVDDSQPPAVVAATLAGEGQVALARDWAAHFKPDAARLSRVLGARFVEALRKHYPSSSLPAATVSLASPSNRATLSSPGIDVAWSDGAWADYVAVGGSPRDVGDVLFEALTGETSMVVRAVELCIRAHACYAMACNVEGMDQVLNVAVGLARKLAESGLFAHLIRLVTGVGNYVRLEFCFSILLESEHFELILRKNPMMSYSARLELRQALHRFLREQRPQDVHSMNLLMLSFNMFREIGESLEAKAASLIKLGRGRASMLVLALTHLLDASDSYHKDRCLQSAERALRMAQLVKLQIYRPTLRLLYENGADIGKLTSYAEACIVANALKLPSDWWVAATFEQGVAGSNAAYLDAALAKQSEIAPLSSVYHDLLSHCKRNGASSAAMSAVLLKLPDIFLAFDLAMEHKLDVADQLAAKSSAIRCFKLLQGQKIKKIND